MSSYAEEFYVELFKRAGILLDIARQTVGTGHSKRAILTTLELRTRRLVHISVLLLR